MEITTRSIAKARGLLRYFTGKPCKNGHVAERVTHNAACIDCKKERDKAYRGKNKETIKAYFAAYYRKDLEKSKKYRADYYAANKEKIKNKVKSYAAANKEKVSVASKRYYAENSEKIKEKTKQYVADNKDKVKACRKRYQQENKIAVLERVKRYKMAKIRRTPLWLTEDDIWMTREIYELAALRTKLTGIEWEVDHIVPLNGENVSGLHIPSNLQVITALENRQKSNVWNPDHVQ